MDGKLTYKLHDNIVILKAAGDYTVYEFLKFWEDVVSDPQVPQRFGVVIDARLSTTNNDSNELRAAGIEMKKWNERVARMAVVVSSMLHFGLTRQSSFYAEEDGRELNPFYELEPAMDWVKEKLK